DLFDAALAVSDVCDGKRPLKRLTHGRLPCIQTLAVEIEFDDMREVALRQHDPFGFKACKRRVVLVNAVYRHTIDGRSRSFSQGLAPLDMRLVEEPCPIDNTEDEGISGAEQHK